MKLKKVNLFFGIVLFIVFLITGYYMQKYFKPQHLDNHIMRMQIRSNHIYILFISLLNIISFKCDLKMDYKYSNYLNILFRFLIMVSGVFAVIAFFKDHTGDLRIRNWTLYTVILSVISVGLVLINELVYLLIEKKKSM